MRLVSARELSPSVRELAFERTDGDLSFEPGQWVNLVMPLDEGKDDRRAYSIASPPGAAARFELAVTRVEDGPFSTKLHELTPGAELRAEGPQGFFTRPKDAGHASLFVATGTGLSPLRSMLLSALEAGAKEPLWLLFGVRKEADVLYSDELRALEAANPNVRVIVTLSQPGDGWTGASGYVQTHVERLLGELAAAGHTAHVYVCGLERMVKAVREVARKGVGLPREQVHSERYD